MAPIKLETLKEFRRRTGLGVLECRDLLAEAGGDMDLAIKRLVRLRPRCVCFSASSGPETGEPKGTGDTSDPAASMD